MMANEETRTPPSGGLAAGESAPSDNLNNAPSNVLQKLRELPLFAQLSDAEFRQVTDLLRSSETPRGALLIEQGGSNTNLYILRRGRAAIRIVDLQDVERLAGFLHVGQIFNEAAFLTGARNGQTVEALEPLTLWYIPRETFLALLDENSDLASHLVYPELPDMQAPQQTRRIRTHAWQRPGEVVLLFRRKHPWFFVRTLWPLPFVAVLVLLLLLPPVNTFVNALLPIILGGVSLVVAAYVLLRFIDWHNDYYAITDQRVIHRERVL
ncbi:MAG: cyclic nucleotide-binding domain-containing protein, partial [Chloroflexi bacterium]|nr:cyclic nucleotide-binding domain-containing protein [Chloroflexota bacterium]